jgi:hypothetical protein
MTGNFMTTQQAKRLRAFYNTLLRFEKMIDDTVGHNIEGGAVMALFEEIERFQNEFPDLLPLFNRRQFFAHRYTEDDWYKISAIRAFLATAIPTVEAELDQDESSPIFETREFPFIADGNLRAILKRDYSEIQRAFVAKCWKSVIILCGGAIEAMLTDLLLKNNSQAQSSPRAGKGADITKWGLSELIEVAVDLDLVTSGAQKLSHSVRDYRNLIHPGNELRNKLTFDAEEAKIALEIMHIMHRDLS